MHQNQQLVRRTPFQTHRCVVIHRSRQHRCFVYIILIFFILLINFNQREIMANNNNNIQQHKNQNGGSIKMADAAFTPSRVVIPPIITETDYNDSLLKYDNPMQLFIQQPLQQLFEKDKIKEKMGDQIHSNNDRIWNLPSTNNIDVNEQLSDYYSRTSAILNSLFNLNKPQQQQQQSKPRQYFDKMDDSNAAIKRNWRELNVAWGKRRENSNIWDKYQGKVTIYFNK